MQVGLKQLTRAGLALALASAVVGNSAAWAKGSRKSRRPKAASNPIVRLEIAPIVRLDGPKMQDQIVVTGIRRHGEQVDMTRKVGFRNYNPKVVKAYRGGLLLPRGNGTTTVEAYYGKLRATAPVEVRNFDQPFKWSFRNHVISVMSKVGCNSGACHGAAAGKNGFRLSLRGYDVKTDYTRLLHEGGGRRIERSHPARSLILMKPSMAIPHAGGLRLPANKRMYGVLSQWIASGMPAPSDKDARLVKLNVFPEHRILDKGAEQQLRVEAQFSDGHVEDVTQ